MILLDFLKLKQTMELNNFQKKTIKNWQWIDNGSSTYVSSQSNNAKGNTFEEEKFKLMSSSAIKEREESIIKKHLMEITVDPRIADALNKSPMLSSTIN